MEVFAAKNGVSVYAYKGDAMTLLAFDLDKKLLKNFVGFTIKVKADSREFYIYNKIRFDSSVDIPNKPDKDYKILSTEFSPIQKFRWIHVPSTIHFIKDPYFGNYTYEVSPRYIENGKLKAIEKKYTVSVTIDVSPFADGDVQVGFARSFISSQAFAHHFGNQLNLRPNKTDIVFDIKEEAGSVSRTDAAGRTTETPFTYEEIHSYLGWQARNLVMKFIEEVEKDHNLILDVFAYDLNEPLIVKKFLKLAEEGRLRILLDDYPEHVKPGSYEMEFEKLFLEVSPRQDNIFRGHFGSQAHSKIFIQRKKGTNEAIKVLTGSTNFTTNGLYVNANHTIIFNRPEVAQLYADVFTASFGKDEMKNFKKSNFAEEDFGFGDETLGEMTIRFSPHPKAKVDEFFSLIETRILEAESDVLFAVMMDASNSQILDALRTQVSSDSVFTYGISDTRDGEDIELYKPGSKRGVKISGLKIATELPKPFNDIIKVPGLGHNIHHKFVVVDFKGANPVVWLGSSNLAYDPEQKNGDNLIEIRDKDIVTVFAIEAIRLVDHFHWLNKRIEADEDEQEWFLFDNTGSKKWYQAYYDAKDLKYLERTLLMK